MMKEKLLIWLLLVLFFVVNAFAEDHEKSTLKLSDLPVIQRWQIPNSRINLGRVGRRYKDIDYDIKRSSSWEAQPQFSEHELELEDDPDKISMDLHHSSNIVEQDTITQHLMPVNTQHLMSVNTAAKKNNVVKPTVSRQVDLYNSVKKISEKRRLIALKPFLPKDQNAKKKRNRRSIDENEEEGFNNEVDVFSKDHENESDDNEEEEENEYNEGRIDETEDVRVRREIEIENAIRKSKIIQSNDLKNGHRNIRKPTNMVKRVLPSTHQENLVKLLKSQRSKIDSIKRNIATTSALIRSNNRGKEAGDLGDEQRKSKVIIQKTFFPENAHEVRHIVPQKSLPSKSIAPAVEVKLITKNHLDHIASSRGNPGATENAVNRQQILHPKDKTGINTANVARAVAVAMEQLKRDQMWGKVFVHVRPSGELKVMVQETRKMDE